MVKSPAKVCFVVAVAENGVIGRSGDLPWRLSSDLKRFRKTTMGKPVIMGRKTFESIGKPLDGRANIVISRSAPASDDGVIWVQTIEQALDEARKAASEVSADEVMVIGGAEIYRALMPQVDRIYLTRVHASPDGDTVFPKLKDQEWREMDSEPLPRGERDDYAATLITLERE
ncbi:MAG: dihydrofolate reductase [Pseudomonadota bacterium]